MPGGLDEAGSGVVCEVALKDAFGRASTRLYSDHSIESM